MTVIMKSDVVAIIRINSGGGNNRTSKVSANVFGYNRSFNFFKRVTDYRMELVKKGGLKGLT